MSLFNKNLTYIREKRGLSQKELASKIGVDQSSVSLWENGMDTTIENAIKIAIVLETPIDKLINDDLSLCCNSNLIAKKPMSEKDYGILVKELLELFSKLNYSQKNSIINLMKNMN